MQTDSNRPEAPNAFEMERRMPRVLPQQIIALVRELANIPRQCTIMLSRTSDWRDASPLGAASRAEVLKGLVRERVQTATDDIRLNATVPCIRIEFREPRPECGEFRGGEALHGLLNLFYTAHVLQFNHLR